MGNRTGTKHRRNKTIAISVIIGVVAAFLIAIPMMSGADGDPADSALSASIAFRQPTTGSVITSADALQPHSFITDWFVQKNEFPSYSVLDPTGNDISAANMVVQVKGRITTGGVSLSSWTFVGNMTILVDNKVFGPVHILNAGETGNPPDPAIIKIDNVYNELSIPVSLLEATWGASNYGNHTIQIKAGGKLTGTFSGSSTPVIKDFQQNLIGQVIIKQNPEATLSFELTSDFGTSGTTTNGGLTTDTWTSKRTNVQSLRDFYPLVGEKIPDINRKNLNLVSVDFQLFENATTSRGSITAVLTRADGTVLARSINGVDKASLTSTYTMYTFTFPDGTRTPSVGDFIVALECQGCDSGNAFMGMNRNNPWPGGNTVFRNVDGVWTELATTDMVGSVTYKQ